MSFPLWKLKQILGDEKISPVGIITGGTSNSVSVATNQGQVIATPVGILVEGDRVTISNNQAYKLSDIGTAIEV
jgi:hypothetical protein